MGARRSKFYQFLVRCSHANPYEAYPSQALKYPH